MCSEGQTHKKTNKDQTVVVRNLQSCRSSIYVTPTCSEGEEEALVGMFLQQSLDPLAHPLIPLVDELLSKVAVNLLGGHLLAGWQRHVVEVRDLRLKG